MTPRVTRVFRIATVAVYAALLAQKVSAETAVEEIVVTARKVAEPLATVPLKIDAYADDGGELGVESLQNLIGRVPGLYFESVWGGGSSAPTLRGLQASPTGDVNVGVFVDGVYQANGTAIDSAPVDVARVEVVRGPQSALFGHSTFAGAIHYVSHAPTEEPDSGFAVEAGSQDFAAATGFLSGPVLHGALLGRIAIGTRTFDGTLRNAADGGLLGGSQREAISMQLHSAAASAVTASVNARFSRSRYTQPAVGTVGFERYDCGAVEPTSRAWSYFCGEIPLQQTFDASLDVPRSDNQVAQTRVALSWPLGVGSITSETSYYRGASSAFRDFDASSGGALFGVCTLGGSCTASGASIDRVVLVEEVQRVGTHVTEVSQELRFRAAVSERVEWSAGTALWRNAANRDSALGAARGTLAPNERLTSLLPVNPGAVGPIALASSALVDDPNAQQITQTLDRDERSVAALFGTVDATFTQRLRLHAELRVAQERRKTETRIASFAPWSGARVPAQRFDEITPRVSLELSPTPRWYGYASAARGAQSGGINSMPGLNPDEQLYDAEFNWTYELGARFRSEGARLGVDVTVYRIDWDDAQTLGFPQTPGIETLITLNTAGIESKGIELALTAQPFAVLRTELGLSLTDAEFIAGSDDPGSRRFCGLSRTNATSSFCTVGPSRQGRADIVPYLDGNAPGRVPRRMWHAAAEISPQLDVPGRFAVRLDANGQDDVYDRGINGARFGERTLVDLRLSYDFGAWSIALWGRNLGDRNYVRALSSRGQPHFPTTPRPLDALYGDGRRFGVSATYSAGSR